MEAMIANIAGKYVVLTLIKNQSGDKDQTTVHGNCFANCISAWMCDAEKASFAQHFKASYSSEIAVDVFLEEGNLL